MQLQVGYPKKLKPQIELTNVGEIRGYADFGCLLRKATD